MTAQGDAPRTPLQAERQRRGWSQARLAAQLRAAAARRGQQIEVTDHLISMISRWENGHRQPSAFYAELLSAAYDLGARELGLPHSSHDRRPAEEVEPWELSEALASSHVGVETLALLERSVRGLDQRYGTAAPRDLLPPITHHIRAVVAALGRSQSISARRRLCAVTGHLAGLRAWLAFDLRDDQTALAWYDVALQPATEAGDEALCGWLLGAKSLVETHRGQHYLALRSIRQGRAHAERGTSSACRAWLAALCGRVEARLSNPAAARFADEEAQGIAASAASEDRRHGMDFDGGRLNLAYSRGELFLLLHEPEMARSLFRRALDVGGPERHKHRAVVRLGLARSHALQREPDQACHQIEQALTLPADQVIGPILQRVRSVREQLQTWREEPAVRELDERLATLGV